MKLLLKISPLYIIGIFIFILSSCSANDNVQGVINSIDNTGIVTLDSEPDIIAAENAFSLLTDTEAADISNIETLLDARKTVNTLLANEVIQKIDALTDISLASASLIFDAEEAYENLTVTQKAEVNNISLLQQAREALDKLIYEDEIETVVSRIETIGEITISRQDFIQKTEEAYNQLSDIQKEAVVNAPILFDAISVLDELIYAFEIEDVISQIDAIGSISLLSLSSIVQAETAYDNLSETQKEEISNISILHEARASIDALIDIDAAEKVSQLISDVDMFTVGYTRQRYDALTENQKTLVLNYNYLLEIELLDIDINQLTFSNLPILTEKEFDEYFTTEIKLLLEEYELFVFRTYGGLYRLYYVEPGIRLDENTYQPVSLTEDEYQKLYVEIKFRLLEILSEYAIESGTGIFDKPTLQYVGIHMHNRFQSPTSNNIERQSVADLQISLLNLYYQDISADYIKMEGFSSFYWEKWLLP